MCSINEHGIHSPFLFHFTLNVIYQRNPFYAYQKLSDIREEHLTDHSTIQIVDFGAGSRKFKGNTRKIRDIALHGISKKKHAELLFRIVNHFQPKTIIELGTSIGITAMYLAEPNRNSSRVFTFEGSPELCQFAKHQFDRNNFKNIDVIEGNFENTLPHFLKTIDLIDFVFIDGHHTKNATIHYFNQLLQKSNHNTVMVFDDINWSKGMQEAWQEIRTNAQVKISIDLFYLGIILFRKEQKEQEHFTIRF